MEMCSLLRIINFIVHANNVTFPISYNITIDNQRDGLHTYGLMHSI